MLLWFVKIYERNLKKLQFTTQLPLVTSLGYVHKILSLILFKTLSGATSYYLRQEVMFLPLFVCFLFVCLSVRLFVARISQKVLNRFSCKFVGGLAIDQGSNH